MKQINCRQSRAVLSVDGETLQLVKGGYGHMTKILSEVSGRSLLSFALKRAGFTKGDVYRIVQTGRAKHQINGDFIYEGIAKGNDRTHFMFRSLSGGWRISFTEADLITEETVFRRLRQASHKAA
ncbi:MAG: hypothetical protein U2P59_00355 [Synergistota bacterium]|nr:hypothetical protein [Synergistota bacterium]